MTQEKNQIQQVLGAVNTDHLVDIVAQNLELVQEENRRKAKEKKKIYQQAWQIVNRDILNERAREKYAEKERYYRYIEEKYDSMKEELVKLRNENKFLKTCVLKEAEASGQIKN